MTSLHETATVPPTNVRLRRTLSSFSILQVVIPGILGVAALLKAHMLLTQPTVHHTWFDSRVFQSSLVSAEILFSAWFLVTSRLRLARGLAILLFGSFLAVSVWKLANGATSCGCFGTVEVHPIWTVLLDTFCLFLLVLSCPDSGFSKSSPRFAEALVPSAVFMFPVVPFTFMALRPVGATLGAGQMVVTSGELVIIEQTTAWLEKDGQHLLKEFDWIETPIRAGITRYRLYVPPGSGNEGRLPLLVWMHGACEGGADNKKHLVYLDELLFRDGQELPPFCILAVQTPTASWPREQSPKRDDPLSVVEDILDHVLAHYPVDADRVFLSGVSSGGDGCWDFACRCPDRFAAICPLASNGGDISQSDKLKNVGIWCFHSSNDVMPKPDSARAMVNAVVASGGRARFTETPPNEAFPHNCWHAAFRDYEVTGWLMSQSRQRTSLLDRTQFSAMRSLELVVNYFRVPVAGSRIWWYSFAALVVLLFFRPIIRRRRKAARGLSISQPADTT